MPLVSVILPTRDRSALLPRAVASVLSQTWEDLELVIVDNNRREGPVAEVHAGAAWLADRRVRILVSGDAQTASAARNRGLDEARGTWIAYADDDDAYRPHKLARQLDLARRAGASIVLCGAAYQLRGRQRNVQCSATEWSGDELLLNAVWGTPFLLHTAGAERFNPAAVVAEDMEFALTLLDRRGVQTVPVAAEPLVDVYPQLGPRVNTRLGARRQVVARVLRLPRLRFSRAARRRYILRMLLTTAKLRADTAGCVRWSARLLRESRGADWRFCANACAVSLGWFRGSWVS